MVFVVQNQNKIYYLILLICLNYSAFSQEKNFGEEVLIPAGEFWMGNNDKQCQCYEHPMHQVKLDAFYIDKYEVTNNRFKLFIDDNGYCDSTFWTPVGWRFRQKHNLLYPKFWEDENFGINHPNKPVVGISWYEAAAFAKWAGKRLPTEAEWERAARSTDKRIFPWGDDKPDDTRCNFGYFFGSTLNASTKDVGSYEAGKSPDGLYDMAGNVSEWCNDWYNIDYYANSPTDNPQGPVSGEFKCLRGGAWYLYVKYMRVTARDFADPENRNNFTGFRCARTP